MSPFLSTPPCSAPRHVEPLSTAEQLLALAWEIQANQYRLVHLAARFDDELEWLRQGVKSASQWIADRLQIRSATARSVACGLRRGRDERSTIPARPSTL